MMSLTADDVGDAGDAGAMAGNGGRTTGARTLTEFVEFSAARLRKALANRM